MDERNSVFGIWECQPNVMTLRNILQYFVVWENSLQTILLMTQTEWLVSLSSSHRFQWGTKVKTGEKRTASMVHTQFAASHLYPAANASPLINSELSFRALLFSSLLFDSDDFNLRKYVTRGSVCERCFWIPPPVKIAESVFEWLCEMICALSKNKLSVIPVKWTFHHFKF